jgi:hypothetical protein
LLMACSKARQHHGAGYDRQSVTHKILLIEMNCPNVGRPERLRADLS